MHSYFVEKNTKVVSLFYYEFEAFYNGILE